MYFYFRNFSTAKTLWHKTHMDRVKRIWYLSPMRAANVQASLRIRTVSPEPSLLAHTSSESRGTFRQKARSLAPLNGWACAVEICHDGMLEDTKSLVGAHIMLKTTTVRTENSFFLNLHKRLPISHANNRQNIVKRVGIIRSWLYLFDWDCH